MGASLLVEIARARGCDADKHLQDAGISKTLLDDPHGRISAAQDIALVSSINQELKDPFLGIEVGRTYRLSALGALGLALSTSETLEHSLQLFLRFVKLSYTYFQVTHIRTETHAILRFDDQYDLGDLKHYYIARDLSFAVNAFSHVFTDVSPEQIVAEVRFDLPQPDNPEKYAELLHCPVKFGCPFNEVLSPVQILSKALPQANALTNKLLIEQCEEQIAKFQNKGQFTEQIRAAIERVEGGLPNLEEIAQELNVTSRTVRRRLTAEGTRFQLIVEQSLRRRAIAMLEENLMTVEQISLTLGYSEASSFIHAFKRWTGKSPKDYRGY